MSNGNKNNNNPQKRTAWDAEPYRTVKRWRPSFLLRERNTIGMFTEVSGLKRPINSVE